MPPAANNWYVVSGGPSSGKTTLIRLLEHRGFATVPEHARHVIDGELIKGRLIKEVRADQQAFQRKVLQLQVEQERTIPPQQVTFFDRGIPDTLAYQRFHGLPEDPSIQAAVANCSYKKVFLLDLLPLISDYARTENVEAQMRIQELLWEIYRAMPFPIVRVPVVPPLARLELVVTSIDQETAQESSQPGAKQPDGESHEHGAD